MRVAVTGCTSDFGTVLLPRLFADPDVEGVLGIDLRKPRVDDDALTFAREDVRSPRLGELFAGHDAVVHLAFVVEEIHDKEETHDINLNGSRNVIEAAAAAGARRLVIASSVSAYGERPDGPGPITEDEFPRGSPDKYYFYDKAEVEHYVEWWLRRHPDSELTITLLRPVVIGGPHFRNSLLRLATAPVSVYPGGAPRAQLLHEDDLADAFHRVVKEDHPGPFNVGPRDSIGLEEMAAIHGQRVAQVPERVARPLADLLFRLRLSPGSSHWVASPETVVDSTRLERKTGWRPTFTSREVGHVIALQAGRPILRSEGELHRREVAEAALAPSTAEARALCAALPGLREGVGGGEGFDTGIARAEHAFLPFRTGELHLEVHEADAAGAPTVLFSPGIGGHARFYSPALIALREAGLNAVGLDRPGHGLSQGRRGDAPMELTLDAVEAAIRFARERWDSPLVLAGSSLGGIITWLALTREPDVDAAICHNVHHPELRHEPAVRIKAPALIGLARVAPFAPVSIKQVADFDSVALDPRSLAYFAEERDPLWCWRISARTAASFFTFRPPVDWSEVAIPTLVLEGEGDAMVTPDYTREVVARGRPPNCELRVLPGLGHLLFHEHLPEAVEQVGGFVPARRGTAGVRTPT